jgi:hypothetical protein
MRPCVCQSAVMSWHASFAALPTVCVAFVPKMSSARFATSIWLLLRSSPPFFFGSLQENSIVSLLHIGTPPRRDELKEWAELGRISYGLELWSI